MMENEEKLFYSWVGKKIILYRKKRKLTQKEFAKKLGLSRVSIVNIEKGRQTPPLFTYWKIAEILNVDPSEILPSRNEHIRPSSDIMKKKLLEIKGLNEDSKEIFSELIKRKNI